MRDENWYQRFQLIGISDRKLKKGITRVHKKIKRETQNGSLKGKNKIIKK